MPNWVSNQIKIITPSLEIFNTVMEQLENGDFPLDPRNVITPEHDTHEAYEKAWGSRCLMDCDVTQDYPVLTYWFLSAWNSVRKLADGIALKYPDCEVIYGYEEGGNNFSGYARYKNGLCIGHGEGNYDAYPITEHETDEDKREDDCASLLADIEKARDREYNDDHLSEEERTALVERYEKLYKDIPGYYELMEYPKDRKMVEKFVYLIFPV